MDQIPWEDPCSWLIDVICDFWEDLCQKREYSACKRRCLLVVQDLCLYTDDCLSSYVVPFVQKGLVCVNIILLWQKGTFLAGPQQQA